MWWYKDPERWSCIVHVNKTTAGVILLILNKVEVRTINIIMDKEKHYIRQWLAVQLFKEI